MANENGKAERGFRVPPELMGLDLSLSQVREIIEARKQTNRVQARLAKVPETVEKYKAQLVELEEVENDLLRKAGVNDEQIAEMRASIKKAAAAKKRKKAAAAKKKAATAS